MLQNISKNKDKNIFQFFNKKLFREKDILQNSYIGFKYYTEGSFIGEEEIIKNKNRKFHLVSLDKVETLVLS